MCLDEPRDRDHQSQLQPADCMVVLSTPGWSVMSGEDPERRTDVGSSQTPARLGVPSTESTMSVPRRTTRPQLPDHCHQNAVVHPAAAAVHLRRLLQTACHQVTQVPSRPPAGRYPGLRVPKLAPRRPARRTAMRRPPRGSGVVWRHPMELFCFRRRMIRHATSKLRTSDVPNLF